MRKFLISAVSLAALTVGGMALAQDQPTTVNPPPPPEATTEPMNQPAQPSTEESTTTTVPKATEGTTTTQQQPPPATTDEAKEAQTTEQPATGTAGFTISGLEAGNVVMASSLIGSTVYSSANENIGDINDIVIAKDGKVLAAIIGVGGFLGLGEKDVAVPMDRIQFARDENNNMKFTISASREELEQAPAFDRTKLIVGGEPTPPVTTTP
jgi:sporulation protein YlmC with PRC-barrel domain